MIEPVALSVSDLHFSYGQIPALEGVTLKADGGELLFIVGPNGCGKSTLLNVLCGQAKPARGSLAMHVGGVATPMGNGVQRARRIALVPQHSTIAFGYTVRQVVLMARWPMHSSGGIMGGLGFETEADHRIADRAMWALDVHHLTDRVVTTLSGGERQRITIARALAQETTAILLDEPTAALDLWHQLELMAHLKELAKEGRTIVVVTHDLNLAREHADRVVVMDMGKVVADGKPSEILTPAVLEPVYRVRVLAGDGLSFGRRAV